MLSQSKIGIADFSKAELDKLRSYWGKSNLPKANILNNSQVGLYGVDVEGNFVLANKYFLGLLGLNSEEELKNYNAFKEGISTNAKREKIKDLLLTEQCIENIEDKWIRKDNTIIKVREKITTYKDPEGIVKGYVGVVQKTNEDIEKKAINKIDNLKSTFLSQLSHEIRTPLNTIVNYVSLLKEEENEFISNSWKEGFTAISKATERIVRTIDLLVKMSEIQTDNYTPKFQKINLNTILQNIVSEYSSIAKDKGLELVYTNNIKNAQILADKPSIIDIFKNILDNAIKYTDSGKIQVYIKRSIKNKVAVTVLDSGIGISKKYIKNLFKPFSQESTGYTRKFDGNGLGLALVKEYCKLNNAEIFVTSEKNNGSNFTVVFGSDVALT